MKKERLYLRAYGDYNLCLKKQLSSIINSISKNTVKKSPLDSNKITLKIKNDEIRVTQVGYLKKAEVLYAIKCLTSHLPNNTLQLKYQYILRKNRSYVLKLRDNGLKPKDIAVSLNLSKKDVLNVLNEERPI